VIVLPWDHQQAAFDAWSQSGRRGIVEMATATGKTLVGLMAIEDMAKSHNEATIRVLSNSRALLNQWKRESVQKLGLLQNVYKDFTIPVNWKGITVYFQTIQSVMDHPENFPTDLLIVDEVHHLAGPEFRKALQIQAPEKMGLSATVEGDVKLSILKEELGPVVYQFGLKDALVKGIIPSFEWKVIPVYLAVDEAEEFASISKGIRGQFSSIKFDIPTILSISGVKHPMKDLGDFIRLVERARYRKMELPEAWKQVQALILKRRWIIHKSKPRLDHAMALGKELAKNRKVILFTMDTESCDYLGDELKKENDQVYVIHSNIKEDPHTLILQFKHAKYGALIGAQMLSEGIDIPDVEIGINVAASKTRLQLTQRMGRILRKGSGKKAPIFYHYVAIPEPSNYIPEEDDIAFLDDLAWVQDTALRMGLDAEVVWNEELLKAQGSQVEDSFHNRFFSKDLAKIPKFGTFNLRYVTSQLSDQSIFRIVAILHNLPADREISDSNWSQIVRVACGKKKQENLRWDHLDIPGYWWLLVLGKRNPANIIEIFNQVRPSLEYSPDEKDERVVQEAVEEIISPGAQLVVSVPEEVVPVPLHVRPRVEMAEVGVSLDAGISADDLAVIPMPSTEKEKSTFKIGDLTVSEVEFGTDDLFEGLPAEEFDGKELSQITLEDLYESE
jgi:superfamily II DNA or RNA helicase